MSYLGRTGAIPKVTRKQRKNTPVKASDGRAKGKKEHSIQMACENILNTNKIEFIRIPDEVYGFVNSGMVQQSIAKLPIVGYFYNLKKSVSKYFKDIPDLIILLDTGEYICVELKTSVGRQSQGQEKIEKRVGSSNYHLVRSEDGFTELLKKYGVM